MQKNTGPSVRRQPRGQTSAEILRAFTGWSSFALSFLNAADTQNADTRLDSIRVELAALRKGVHDIN